MQRHAGLLQLLPGPEEQDQRNLRRRFPKTLRCRLSQHHRARDGDLSRVPAMGGGGQESRQYRTHEGHRGTGNRNQHRCALGQGHDRSSDPPLRPRRSHCRSERQETQGARRLRAAEAVGHRRGVRPHQESNRQPAIRHQDLKAGWPATLFGNSERGSHCSASDPGPLRHRQPGADQRRAGDYFRHDAGHQSRTWGISDARGLCGDRRYQPRHQHLDRDAGGGAHRGRHHRRHRRIDDHPLPVRADGRHHARDLGPQPVSGGADDGDLRQHHGRHLGAARQFPDRRLSHQRIHVVRHRRGGRRDGRHLRCAALDAPRSDCPRHDAECQHGGSAGGESTARLCRHLRHRCRLVRSCRRGAGAGFRRLSHHRRRLCRQILHHGDRWRRRHSQRHGFCIGAVGDHQADRDVCHDPGVRRGGAAVDRHRPDPPAAAGHHGSFLSERYVNARALNFIGLGLVGIIGVAFLVLTPRLAELDTVLELTVYMIMAILALSLALIWGYGGILCFGQSAFFGLGAYAYAIAMFNIGESTVPLLLAIALPAAFAALLGYFMFYGRISDVYLGVITLTVTLILFNSVNSTAGPEFHIGVARLGGFNGIPGIPPLNFPGNKAAAIDLEGMFYLATAALLAPYFGLRLLLASRFGRVIVGIRENERRAELLGYDPRAYKLVTFTIGGALAGFAGCRFANWGNFVSPTIFGLAQSAQIIIWVIVGGRGTLIGPIVGCIGIQWLNTALGANQPSGSDLLGKLLANAPLILGIILIAFVLLVPKGLVPTLGDWGQSLLLRSRTRRLAAALKPKQAEEG